MTEKKSAQEQWTEKGTKTLRNQGFKEEEGLKSVAGASGHLISYRKLKFLALSLQLLAWVVQLPEPHL